VERANDRMADVPGEFVVGAAANAERLFEPGSYDTVIAFELIEHVPDPAGLLHALERMLAPGGRILVSSPDGTFGAGQNPHHLRALRFIDLFELLRSRGKIEDGLIGEDGVSVLAYSPAEQRGKVAIYTGPSWMPWHPGDMEGLAPE